MTEQEWLVIGYNSGAVTRGYYDEMTFREAYETWFKMKINGVRPPTLDRLECTYNRYFKNTEYELVCVSTLDDEKVSGMITAIMLSHSGMDEREYKRLYQIVNNVLVYCHDMNLGGALLIDWNKVKRYVPRYHICKPYCIDKPVSNDMIDYLEYQVRYEKIYEVKQSACLCLLLNFYLGLRVGELAVLRWADIDMVDRLVHVRHTETKAYSRDESGQRGKMQYIVADELKTDRGLRDVPLCEKAVELINEIYQHHTMMGYCTQSQFLAYDGNGTTVLVRSLDRTLRRLCYLCGVPAFNTHLIRKTFASRLHDGGMSTRMISDLMGHADMSTTERFYILGYNEELDRARSMMNDIYARDSASCEAVCT